MALPFCLICLPVACRFTSMELGATKPDSFHAGFPIGKAQLFCCGFKCRFVRPSEEGEGGAAAQQVDVVVEKKDEKTKPDENTPLSMERK